jgi:O-antigen ligase
MKSPQVPLLVPDKLARWLTYLLLASTTLAVNVNSFDSGMIKAPLLILFAGALALWFATTISIRGEITLPPMRILVPILLFLVLLSSSLFYSEVPWATRNAVPIWMAWLLCFVAGFSLFTKREDLATLFRVLLGIGAIVATVGLVQFFFYKDLAIDFFIDIDRRVVSTLTNATYLSGYIALLIPALFGFYLDSRKSSRVRVTTLAILLALGVLLFFTATRSSLIAFVASMSIFVLALRVRPGKALAAGSLLLILVIAAGILSPRLVERVENTFSENPTSSFARRIVFWKAGIASVVDAPFFGHGLGTYEQVMLRYRPADYWTTKSEDVVPHAHNDFVETASDLGGIGLLLYAMIVVASMLPSRSSPRKNNQSPLRVGLVCAVLALLIDNLANLSLRVEPIGATFWLFLGIIAAGGNRTEHGSSLHFTPLKWMPAVAGLALAGFVWWYGDLQIDRLRADGHAIRGFLADHAGKNDDAIQEYREAVILDPYNLLAQSSLSVSYLKARDFENAIKTAQHLLTISPLYPKTHLILGIARISRREFHPALDALSGEERQRNHPEVYFYKAETYQALQDTVQELLALRQMLLACERGRIDFELTALSPRVLELLHDSENIREFSAIYGRLGMLFPGNTNLTSVSRTLAKRLQAAHSGAESHPR